MAVQEPVEPGLDMLFEHGLISRQDYFFARSMNRIFPEDGERVLVSAALVSRALSQGVAFLDLKKAAGSVLSSFLDDELSRGGKEDHSRPAGIRLPEIEDWTASLKTAHMVNACPVCQASGSRNGPVKAHPLVLDQGGCLYLSRYYDFQQRLSDNIRRRVRAGSPDMDPDFALQQSALPFQGQDPVTTGPQQQAVRKALTQYFTVISGGPGTGKTHITDIIQSLVLAYAKSRNLPCPKVVCLAPTGKAAARLTKGATIHSALVPLKDRPGFVHNRDNPLAADLVIIDEASMIDLALMTRLLEALPLYARVILLGDGHQLSPVQAGAVFSEICATPALDGHKVFLEYNFRSGGKTGLENIADAIRRNDVSKLTAVLKQGDFDDLMFKEPGRAGGKNALLQELVLQGYQKFSAAGNLADALEKTDDFRILCAHNRGEAGTGQVNGICEKILRIRGDSGIKNKFFKRMIMIRLNDYDKGLFNGDTGVVFGQDGKGERAGFKMPDKTIRTYRYADLPAHEPAWAVTIHKSQGSEFDTVLIIIPDQLSPVVTRSLLYTGVTRARKKAVILGKMDVIRAAMGAGQEQTSNLSAFLEDALARNPSGR